MYTGYLDYRNRLLLNHPISTIETKAYNTPEEAHAALSRLVEMVQPMNGEYSTCVVEHS